MGGKASTSASPSDEDSSPSRHQVYTHAERVRQEDSLSSGCRTSVQQPPQRSFIERAEHSLHSLMYNSNSSGVDIQRSSQSIEFGSPLAAVSQSAGSNSSRQSGSIPAAATNIHNAAARNGHDSHSSSIGSNTTTGLSHFLSNFNLWRASAGQPSGTAAERQRSTSLSHVSADQSRNYASVEGATADESSAMSSSRAALTRLLSSRDGRNPCSHPAGESSGSSSSSGSTSSHNHQHIHIHNPRPRRDSSTTNSATTTAFSMRDLTYATAQEFLAEATMNGMGLGRVYVTHSLPSHMWTVNGIKCPVCSKFVMPDDIECHLVMCLTKPRLNYNEDVLTEDKGECVICLEDLLKGHIIARLPCLCVYHKSCIDQWFDVNRSCPEHPSD